MTRRLLGQRFEVAGRGQSDYDDTKKRTEELRMDGLGEFVNVATVAALGILAVLFGRFAFRDKRPF